MLQLSNWWGGLQIDQGAWWYNGGLCSTYNIVWEGGGSTDVFRVWFVLQSINLIHYNPPRI